MLTVALFTLVKKWSESKRPSREWRGGVCLSWSSLILKIHVKMAGTGICNPRTGETETGAPLRLTGQSTLTGKL